MSTKAVKKQSLVERIMAVLGLDDAGKIQKFFDREKKALLKEIKSHEANKKVDEINFDNTIEGLQDKLEDANDQYEEAKLAITPEDVTTNDAMDRFSRTYWTNLAEKKRNVEFLEKQFEQLKLDLESDQEQTDKEIKLCKDKIAIIEEMK